MVVDDMLLLLHHGLLLVHRPLLHLLLLVHPVNASNLLKTEPEDHKQGPDCGSEVTAAASAAAAAAAPEASRWPSAPFWTEDSGKVS